MLLDIMEFMMKKYIKMCTFPLITSHITMATIDVEASDYYPIEDNNPSPSMKADIAPLRSIHSLLLPEEKEIMPRSQCLLGVLVRLGASFRLVEHESEGQSDKVSVLRGSTLEQSAKMMVVMSKIDNKKRAYTLAIVPAYQQVSFENISALVKARESLRAPLDRAENLTQCISGAILPFSFNDELKTVVDPLLVKNERIEEIAFNLTLTQSMFLKVKDYLRIARPFIYKISR